MIDIVDDLIRCAESSSHPSTILDAAAEIKRLRAAAAELLWDVNASLEIDRQKDDENERLLTILDSRNDQILTLEVELSKLRAALTEISSLGSQKKSSASYAMASIARAALIKG